MRDPIEELAHDHAGINRQVLELGGVITGVIPPIGDSLVGRLAALREDLFLHFAREEEGLFPFVTEHIPELADAVHGMAIAHDTICGVLARMYYMAQSEAEPASLRAFFERFQLAYAEHSRSETTLLHTLTTRLDATQRAELAALVRDL